MKTKSIKEIKELLKSVHNEDDPIIIQLSNDSRKGVQNLLEKWIQKQQQLENDKQKYKEMLVYEEKAKSRGFNLIAGIDEVGRGPLAGPVVSAAVILPENVVFYGLDDSKKLSISKRESLYNEIKENAIAIGVGIISHEEIDRVNIYEATKKSMLAAIQNLKIKPDYLLIDAMKLNSIYPEESIIKGDAHSLSIAAASIIAKVTRDNIMNDYHQKYPLYGFNEHMGYGTKKHMNAIHLYGPCPIHRKSFAPFKSLT